MKVYYMNGAGNDFMVIDARGLTLDYPALARKCCAVTGADGFMATDISDKADFRLHFYNSDGTRGEMCGNGARCICRFGHDIGLAGDVMTVETDAGLVPGWRLDENLYRVKLNNPYVLDLHRKGDVAYLELGTPAFPTRWRSTRATCGRMRTSCWKRSGRCALTPRSPRGQT